MTIFGYRVVALAFDNSNDLIYAKEALDHNNPADGTKFPDPFAQEIIERGESTDPALREKESVGSSHSPVLVELCNAKPERSMSMFRVSDPYTDSNVKNWYIVLLALSLLCVHFFCLDTNILWWNCGKHAGLLRRAGEDKVGPLHA